jgi:hypothetical protein
MAANLRTLTNEKREYPMKRHLVPAIPVPIISKEKNSMKRHIYLAILVAGCLLVAMPSFAGNIYLTGHDIDFHCALQSAPTSCNAFKIAFNLGRAGAPNPAKPVLFLDQGCNSEGCTPGSNETAMAANNAGIPSTSYTVVDPSSAGFATLPLTTANYSAILFASDVDCGGCDNTVSGETAINSRSADIQNFFIAGGGLVYLSGADSTIYYTSVPAGFAVEPTAANPANPATNGCLTSPTPGPCYTLTSVGTALGLTNNDANCCATHNSFVPFSNIEGPTGSSALLSVAELDASQNDETLFATNNPPTPGDGSPSVAVLTFPAGNNSSATGTFNCPSGQKPCPDANAHSMKFTVGTVSTSFSILLTATEVTGNGICESGIPDDQLATSMDCRFVRFFGQPPFSPTSAPNLNTKVPFCYPYSHNKCVFYSVTNDPPPPGQTGSPYSNGVNFLIAWNNVFSAPAGWVNSPRMYDDPSNDHDSDPTHYPSISDPSGNNNVFPYLVAQPEDSQFVFDITTFFNPAPGGVGMDPVGGTGKTFNDFAVAFPFSLAQVQQPINSDGSSVFNANRGVIPVKFTYSVDGAATCNLAPATISLTRLSGALPGGSIDESTYIMSADNGSNFRISGCQYIYNLDAKSIGVGTYLVKIFINSKLAGSAFFKLK